VDQVTMFLLNTPLTHSGSLLSCHSVNVDKMSVFHQKPQSR